MKKSTKIALIVSAVIVIAAIVFGIWWDTTKYSREIRRLDNQIEVLEKARDTAQRRLDDLEEYQKKYS